LLHIIPVSGNNLNASFVRLFALWMHKRWSDTGRAPRNESALVGILSSHRYVTDPGRCLRSNMSGMFEQSEMYKCVRVRGHVVKVVRLRYNGDKMRRLFKAGGRLSKTLPED
jgi:hypothetical protein